MTDATTASTSANAVKTALRTRRLRWPDGRPGENRFAPRGCRARLDDPDTGQSYAFTFWVWRPRGYARVRWAVLVHVVDPGDHGGRPTIWARPSGRDARNALTAWHHAIRAARAAAQRYREQTYPHGR